MNIANVQMRRGGLPPVVCGTAAEKRPAFLDALYREVRAGKVRCGLRTVVCTRGCLVFAAYELHIRKNGGDGTIWKQINTISTPSYHCCAIRRSMHTRGVRSGIKAQMAGTGRLPSNTPPILYGTLPK